MGYSTEHISVLKEEMLKGLDPQPGDIVVDATVGAGGHSEALLERIGPSGRLIAIDQDSKALAIAEANLNKYSNRCTFIKGNFDSLSQILEDLDIDHVDIIFADLGVSSMQLDNPERGFSFDKDGPLSMTMNLEKLGTASDILNKASEAELAKIFIEYGEENHKNARLVAREIIKAREKETFSSTLQLNTFLDRVLKASKKRPAIRIFQALRIAVNDELGVLERFLPQAKKFLLTNSRLGIISFHSLEDKIVKKYLQSESLDYIAAKDGNRYPKKPSFTDIKRFLPTKEEIEANPRSRSAILRTARRV